MLQPTAAQHGRQRSSSKFGREGGNSLLIDAGDRFTGTLFHQQWQGQDAARIMNELKYDLMAVGNHEFDDRAENLAKFVGSVNFPLISANIDFSNSPSLAGKIQPYAILEIGGEKIGFIGLTPPDTTTLSSPGKELTFSAYLRADLRDPRIPAFLNA